MQLGSQCFLVVLWIEMYDALGATGSSEADLLHCKDRTPEGCVSFWQPDLVESPWVACLLRGRMLCSLIAYLRTICYIHQRHCIPLTCINLLYFFRAVLQVYWTGCDSCVCLNQYTQKTSSRQGTVCSTSIACWVQHCTDTRSVDTVKLHSVFADSGLQSLA